MLYIVLFLHQTTTPCLSSMQYQCCISYYSYIKPQPPRHSRHSLHSCISYYSYIKPQLSKNGTRMRNRCISYYSYIKPQLVPKMCLFNEVVYRTIPTSNHNWYRCSIAISLLYIVLFLHQTTTLYKHHISFFCCISYYSYIKPQLKRRRVPL